MSEYRENFQLREISFQTDWISTAHGSCLGQFGNTRVLATAMYSEGVPQFIDGEVSGWLTAEYRMLPGSSTTRIHRERSSKSGRTQEIQRLIGRALRAGVDLSAFPGYTIHVDVDVLQADGGTRTTGINTAMVALVLCARKMQEALGFSGIVTDMISAVSVGIVDGQYILDLDYSQDSHAEVDMNVVMRNGSGLIEVQGTAEQGEFSRPQLDELLDLAENGIGRILQKQGEAIGEIE